MHLALELTTQDINLMDADTQKLSELLRRASHDDALIPFAPRLEELAAYMEDFIHAAQPPEKEPETPGEQPTVQRESLTAAQQRDLARTLFARIHALDDSQLVEIENLFRDVIQKAPDTEYAQESYWLLSNLYMRGFSPRRNLDAIDILETYLERYPDSTFLDDHFAMFATVAMPIAKKRLLHLYEMEQLWSKAADLYGELITDLDASSQELLASYISYGRALERLNREQEAIAVYQAYLRNSETDSRVLQNIARRRLSALGAEVPEAKVRSTFTNLYDAARAGSLEEVKRLIDEGADVTARRIVGAPRYGGAPEPNPIGPPDPGTESIDPLHLAVANGHTEVVRYLVAQGADPGSEGEHHWRLPLMLAAELSDRAMTNILLEAGAQVNATGRGGTTALHFAALTADPDVVQALIDAGGSIEQACRRGQLPLHYAAGNPDISVAKLLIEAGAEVDARDNTLRTALHLAIATNNLAVGELLLSSHADAGAAMAGGNTPLHEAARLDENARPWVDMLLQKEVDVLAENDANETAFHLAAVNHQVEILEPLFADGINLEQETYGGKTYLHLAAMGGHLEMVQSLVDKGADIHAQSHSGRTALELADSNGHAEVAAFLQSVAPMRQPEEGLAMPTQPQEARLEMGLEVQFTLPTGWQTEIEGDSRLVFSTGLPEEHSFFIESPDFTLDDAFRIWGGSQFGSLLRRPGVLMGEPVTLYRVARRDFGSVDPRAERANLIFAKLGRCIEPVTRDQEIFLGDSGPGAATNVVIGFYSAEGFDGFDPGDGFDALLATLEITLPSHLVPCPAERAGPPEALDAPHRLEDDRVLWSLLGLELTLPAAFQPEWIDDEGAHFLAEGFPSGSDTELTLFLDSAVIDSALEIAEHDEAGIQLSALDIDGLGQARLVLADMRGDPRDPAMIHVLALPPQAPIPGLGIFTQPDDAAAFDFASAKAMQRAIINSVAPAGSRPTLAPLELNLPGCIGQRDSAE